MTARTFKRQILLAMTMLLLLSTLTLLGGVKWSSLEDASRSMIAVYISVAAAWITFCLQRRIAYTNALRSLWEKTAETIQDCIYFTQQEDRSDDDLNKILRKLSCRIEDVRGVFKNIGELYIAPSQENLNYVIAIKISRTLDDIKHISPPSASSDGSGLYPLESLKQIYHIIHQLGSSKSQGSNPELSIVARKSIESLWKILRTQLLNELERDHPQFPDSPFVHTFKSQSKLIKKNIKITR